MEKVKEKKTAEKQRAKKKAAARSVAARGRIFQGTVIRKFPKRVTIEFERTVYVPKYERFLKKSGRIHARLPDTLASEIHEGDLIKIQECRPLSKIIHFIVIEKVRSAEDKK